MPIYSVYGGALESEIPFATLPPGEGAPRWTLRLASGSPPASLPHAQLLGEDEVDASTRVRLFRHPGGFRLEYDDTGVFDVDAEGTTIHWYAGERAVAEAVQLDVLGRVLPTAMHASGALCLHGSAVELNQGAVAFLAPKRHGKSTLARAATRAGARVVTDDVVAIDLDPAPRMRPGVAQLRLLRDSARYLGGGDDAPAAAGGKVIINPHESSLATASEFPLAALYLLQPVRGESAVESVERVRLEGVAAAMALLPQTRLAPLLGKFEASVLLDRAARLAAVVPIYTLRVARDFDRLDDVVSRLLAWHGGAPNVEQRTSAAMGAQA